MELIEIFAISSTTARLSTSTITTSTLKLSEHLMVRLQLQFVLQKDARVYFDCMGIISGLPTL